MRRLKAAGVGRVSVTNGVASCRGGKLKAAVVPFIYVELIVLKLFL